MWEVFGHKTGLLYARGQSKADCSRFLVRHYSYYLGGNNANTGRKKTKPYLYDEPLYYAWRGKNGTVQ